MNRRTLLRVALVLSIAATALVGGFPLARSSPFPETEMRTISIAARALLPQGSNGSVMLAPGGVVRARDASMTAPVRMCAPVWFTAVALTWDQPAGRPPSVRVAAGADLASVGPIAVIDTESSADPGSREYGTGEQGSELLWTGAARCVRFQMDLAAGSSVSNLRAHFINSSGTSGGPGTGPRNAGSLASGEPGLFAPSAAQALTSQPHFITRAEWGADDSLMNCTPGVAEAVKMAFVHHTAGTNNYSRAEADDVLRAILAYHTNGRGFCDIAYNVLIDRFGRPYEGRSGGLTVPIISAATQGFNTGSFSVSVMGNFDSVTPSKKVRGTLERVLAWRLDVAHVRPTSRARMVSGGGSNTRYSKGTEVVLSAVSGHRHTGFTACPGQRLFDLLPGIRSAAAGMGLPKLYHPTLSTTEISASVAQDVRIKAKGSETMDWSVTVLDALGAVVASLPGQTGTQLDLIWAASGGIPQPTVPGTYQVVVAAQTAKGGIARPASLPLEVTVATSPSPSPTPSPT